MQLLSQRKVFIPCVVFIECNGKHFGAEKKPNQGVELMYIAQPNSQNSNDSSERLQQFLVKGFVGESPIQCKDVIKVVSRFISEGKITLIISCNKKIFLSKGLESSLRHFILHISTANPTCYVQHITETLVSSGLSQLKNPQDVKTIPHTHGSSLIPYISEKNKNKPQKLPAFNSISAVISRSLIQPIHAEPVLKKRRYTSTSNAFISILTILCDDLLELILKMYGSDPEWASVCKRFWAIRKHSRTTLRICQYPCHRPNILSERTFQASDLPSALIQGWIVGSPRLRILDLSQAPVFSNADLEHLFNCLNRPKHLYALNLNGSGRITDTTIRGMLYRLSFLRRLNLMNIPHLSDDALIPLRQGRRLNFKLEALWLGNVTNRGCGNASRMNGLFGDKTLNNIIGTPESTTQWKPPLIQSLTLAHCPALKQLEALPSIRHTLVELDIRGNSVTDKTAATIFQSLTELKYLNISMSDLGDATVATLLEKCPNIEIIDISDLSQLGTQNPNLLCAAPDQWKKLKMIKLSRNSFISNDAIIALIYKCKKLNLLDVTGSLGLSSNSITHFMVEETATRAGFPSLQFVIGDSSLSLNSLKFTLRPLKVFVTDRPVCQ